MGRIFPVLFLFLLFLLPVKGLSGEEGYASWYGPKFHGRRTANGEIYNMHKLTAAHKTLPFGIYVLVTNLDNGATVVVRINDRGPFVKGRIIDLSRAAAERIDMIRMGTARVKIERYDPSAPKAVFYSIQVGSYTRTENAAAVVARLADRGLKAAAVKSPAGTFRVMISRIPSADVKHVQDELDSAGFSGYLVRRE
jgi:rare lipoprotein A